MKAQTTTTEPGHIPIMRIKMVREGYTEYTDETVDNPITAANILGQFFEELDREAFVVLCLSNACTPVGVNVVSIGTLNSTLTSPREVFKPAILSNAAGVIVAHNHPSGQLKPSRNDKDTTRRLSKVGKALEIPLHDHLIFGNDPGDWKSLKFSHSELF